MTNFILASCRVEAARVSAKIIGADPAGHITVLELAARAAIVWNPLVYLVHPAATLAAVKFIQAVDISM